MRDVCLLAWRSLSFHWLRNALLTGSLATALFVPAVVYVLVQRAAESLRERADSTPLVLGAAGSDTDLTLMSLYFAGRSATPISVGDVDAIDPQLATVLPLHVRFHARGRPVVGVTPEYFQHRGLTLSSGDAWQRPGDCLLGHQVAAELAARAGDRLTTDSETVFDLAGNYPLRMRVRGVLAATGTADDLAVFVALETAWILEGIGHGHTSAGEAGTESGDQPHSTAKPFTEVTEENAGSFHFHGRRAGFPLTSALVLPR